MRLQRSMTSVFLVCANFSLMMGIVRAQSIKCVDLSSLDELEAGQAIYTDGGEANDALSILRFYGVDTIRLRLFHTPGVLRDGLSDVLRLARRADSIGYKIILDIHYSDTWADPGHQTKPAAWENVPLVSLLDSVYAHTFAAVTALVVQQTPPVIVQIGNEITSGMLWDTGRTGGVYDQSSQWEALSALLNAGIQAVRASSNARVMIHIDRGGDPLGAQWFFDRLTPLAMDFDIIGISYYPWIHGGLVNLDRTVGLLRGRYDKPVILIETAYPWTLGWNDDKHNPVGLPEHVLPGYPATPEGQADYLAIVSGMVPDGVCYWAPEMIAAPGFRSSWENLALFDFDGEVLPGARVLGSGSTPIDPVHSLEVPALEIFPNPVQSTALMVTIRRNRSRCVGLQIFNNLGRLIYIAADSCALEIQLSLPRFVPGVYWVHSAGHRAMPLVIMP